jgi:hypothetical protein
VRAGVSRFRPGDTERIAAGLSSGTRGARYRWRLRPREVERAVSIGHPSGRRRCKGTCRFRLAGVGAVSANGHPSGRRRCEALFGFGRRARSGAGKRAPVRESRSRISLRFRLEGVRRRRQTGTSADAPPAIGHRPGVDVTASTSASVGGGGVHQQMDTWSLTRGCADLSSASVGGGESPSARGHPSGRRCGASFCRFGGGG